MTEKMLTALQVIASWDEVDTGKMTTSELREIIRSMSAVANEALEPAPAPELFPWQQGSTLKS